MVPSSEEQRDGPRPKDRYDAAGERPRMARKLDLLEFALFRQRRPQARDNELKRCRESWIHFGSC